MSKKKKNSNNNNNINTETSINDISVNDVNVDEKNDKKDGNQNITPDIIESNNEIESTDKIESEEVLEDNKPHMSDFMGNGNDVFTTYKVKYENTMSSAIILLFFGVAGIISTICILCGFINLPLSTFQHVFLTSLYIIFLVYGIISFFKALDYKEKISTENTMEDTIDRYLENHISQEYLDSLHDESITEEENYVQYIKSIQETFLKENPDFDKDLVEYHIDSFLNENF